MRIPRKLKKELKKALINKIGGGIWKPKEVKINKVETYWNYKHRDNFPRYKNKVLTAYELG